MEIKKSMNLSYPDIYEMEDLEERRLYINSGIDEEVIDTIVYHIMRYNREDKDIEDASKRTPIKLYINSVGGDTYNGYALISAIQSSITPIYTINQGMCASMAFLIFIAGDERFSMKNSTFLMHEGMNGGFDNTSKMRERIEYETGELERLTKDFVLENTKITNELYDEKYRAEWYMLPTKAKEYGIVDYIVGVDCTIDEIL